MKSIFVGLYYILFSHLPSSFFPMGRSFNSMRIMCLRRFAKIGTGCKIQSGVYVGKGENIEIGNYCQVNENVQLSNVRLGNYVMIAPGVTILGRMHQHSDTTIPMVLQGEIDTAQTIIEDDVWIGTNAIIMPGLTIQKGCIIAAGAVVTKNCQSYGIYGGVPATLLKIRK